MEILNRQANHNYFTYETYEAGIALTGTEIKSIRSGKCNIKDSYCIVKNNESLHIYEKDCNMVNDATRYFNMNIKNHQITEVVLGNDINTIN